MSKKGIALLLTISIMLVACQRTQPVFIKVPESTSTVGEVHIEIQQPPAGQAANINTVKTPTLEILSPKEGDVLTGGTVTVKVKSEGIDVVDYTKYRKPTAGQGHFHYFIDQGDYAYSYLPSYTYTNVANGEHEIEVFIANNDHTSLNPPVVAKVKFVMK